MSITPQDILEQEFRVRFRGFDMGEVDAFLESVAEHFFKTLEENQRLNDQLAKLQKGGQVPQPAVDLSGALDELKQATEQINAELAGLKEDRQVFSSLEENLKEVIASATEAASQVTSQGGQTQVPNEDFSGALGELKQATEQINTELAGLKEDRQVFSNLEENLKEVIASASETASQVTSQDGQTLVPNEDFSGALDELKQVTGQVNAELTGLKEDRQVFSSLEENLKEVIASASKAASQVTSQGSQDAPVTSAGELDELRQSSEKISTELADLKKQIDTLQQPREQLQSEIGEILQAHLGQMEERILKELHGAAPQTQEPEKASAQKPSGKPAKASKQARKKEVVESRVLEGDAELPDYDMQEPDDGTHFVEADILNEDKLRDLFASIMDDDETPQAAETSSDVLFSGQDLVEDGHEPEVTFILDDALEEDEPGPQAGNKQNN